MPSSEQTNAQLSSMIAQYRAGGMTKQELAERSYPFLLSIARWAVKYSPTYDDVPDILQHIAERLIVAVDEKGEKGSDFDTELVSSLYTEAGAIARVEYRCAVQHTELRRDAKVLFDKSGRSVEETTMDFEHRVSQLVALEEVEEKLAPLLSRGGVPIAEKKKKKGSRLKGDQRRKPDKESRVYQLRQKLGYTQNECVKVLGIPIGRLRRFEQGIEEPPDWVIDDLEAQLSNCVGYSLDLSQPMDRITREWMHMAACKTPSDLAKVLGLSTKNVTRWLNNQYRPSDRVIHRHAQRVNAYVQAKRLSEWV